MEGRFSDASYGHWVLAVEALPERQDTATTTSTSAAFAKHSALADLYAAYHHAHAHATQPFTAQAPHTLLQAASFVLHRLGDVSLSPAPPGISRAHALYVLATQAEKLGAQATARRAYDALASLHLPHAWRGAVGLRRLELRAIANATDPPELLPLCYRCGRRNSLLPSPDGEAIAAAAASSGDGCHGCGHPFVRSMLTFEVLPLVEFAPDPAEAPTTEQALSVLRAGDDADAEEGARRFNACVARALAMQQQEQREREEQKQQGRSARSNKTRRRSSSSSSSYAPVLLGAHDLRCLRREEVFVVRAQLLSSGAHELSSTQASTDKQRSSCRYYRNMLHPDVPLALSQAAGRFAGEEAFEAAWLRAREEGKGGLEEEEKEGVESVGWGEVDGPSCPFSRVRRVGDYGAV